MKKKCYLLIGVPGSGKSWVTTHLPAIKFKVCHHDDFIGMPPHSYFNSVVRSLRDQELPVVAEAPFGISEMKDGLETQGFEVVPVFILEDESVLSTRYKHRELKPIPTGHLTRQKTYRERAQEWSAFNGTSQEVLEHMKVV